MGRIFTGSDLRSPGDHGARCQCGQSGGAWERSFIGRTFLTHELSQAITRNAASEFTPSWSGRRANARSLPAVN
jgi:hypothetical protein